MNDIQIKGFKAFLYYLGLISVILSPLLWIIYFIIYFAIPRKPVKKGYAINANQKMLYIVGIISAASLALVILMTGSGIVRGLIRALL